MKEYLFYALFESSGILYADVDNLGNKVSLGYKNEYIFLYKGKVILNKCKATDRPYEFSMSEDYWISQYLGKIYGVIPKFYYIDLHSIEGKLGICRVCTYGKKSKDHYLRISKFREEDSGQIIPFDEFFVKKADGTELHFKLNGK